MENQSIEAAFLAWRDGGDLRALGSVFDEVAPELFAVARHLAHGASEAEDLVQDTFLVAIGRAASFDRERTLRPWLFGILAIEARKARAGRASDAARVGAERSNAALESAASNVDEPVDGMARKELCAAVSLAVQSLPPHYASVVALHLEDGLAPREIAPRLSISSELARTHLSRGLERLRKSLPASTSSAWSAAGLGPVVARVRARVLAGAENVRPAAVAASASMSAMLAVVLLTSVCAAGGIAFAVLRKAPATNVTAVTAPADAAANARESADASGASAANLAGAQTTSARAPASPVAEQAATKSVARVHGRILLPDGAPASGLIVEAKSFSRDDDRLLETVRASCGTDGRFEIVLKRDRPLSIGLYVEQKGCANARGIVGDVAPGTDSDVGELTLVRGGTLRARLVDSQSHALVEGWELVSNADAPQTHSANKRWIFINQAKVDARDGTCALTGLPLGEMLIVARNPLCREVQVRQRVTIVEGQEATAEFVYSGPDLAQRILVRTKGKFAASLAFGPVPETVHVRRADESSMRKCTHSMLGQCAYDGLEPGDYSIEIDDARFVRWVEPHVQPGQVVTAELVGSAGVRLSVVGADGKPITRYGVTVAFPGASFYPSEFELLAKGSAAPADGRIEGLIPQSCVLVVAPEGVPERRLRLDDLHRGETREVRVDYSDSAAITGSVSDAEGHALSRVAIELTLGERAGRDGPRMTTGVTKGATMTITRGSAVESPTAITRGGDVTPTAITRKAVSDEHGRFEFGTLERGTWTVRARFSRWLTADKTIALGAEAPPPLEIMRPPSGSLSGKLVMPAGANVTDVELVLDNDFARAPVSEANPPAIPIAADGSFRVGPLPAGKHVLSALVGAGSRTDAGSPGTHASFNNIRDLGRFEITAGRDVEQSFDIGGAIPARVSVTVTSNGVPLEKASVAAPTESRSGKRPPTTIALGDGGRATIGVPASERVHLMIIAREQGWIWRSSEVLEAKSGATLERTIDVQLVKHTLHVVDARTRAPLALHEVRWSAAIDGLTAEARGKTDAQGNLELMLPGGRYDVSSAAGGASWSVDLGPTPAGSIEVRLDRG